MKFHSIWEGDQDYPGTTIRLLTGYGFIHTKDPEDADFLVFNGGADIATEIYSEEPVFKSIPSYKSHRDDYEIDLFNQFKDKKFFLGICRGAQLLNCLSGGTLWQHVNNHQIDHPMYDLITGKKFTVTSTHHQMMRPTKYAEIIGIANQSTRKMADQVEWVLNRSELEDGDRDIEVVWYKDTKSLCIQGHPEYVPGSKFADWSVDLLKQKMKEAS